MDFIKLTYFIIFSLLSGSNGVRDEMKIAPVNPSSTIFPSPDTCSSYFSGPFYYWIEDYQVECEAALCDAIGQTNFLWAFHITWFNYDSIPRSKDVVLYVWEDNNGIPGNVIWSIDTTTGEIPPNEAQWIQYDILDIIEINGPVWYGHYETVPGAPTSIFDLNPEISSLYSLDCSQWYQEYDHLQMLGFGSTPPVSIQEGDGLPSNFNINPNPAGDISFISFSLRKGQNVYLRLYDVNGRLIKTLLEGYFHPGQYKRKWKVVDLSPGVYFYIIETEGIKTVKKVVIVR
jgi:hypothetical protein